MREHKPTFMTELNLPFLGRILLIVDWNRSVRYDRLADVSEGEAHIMAGPIEVFATPRSVLKKEGLPDERQWQTDTRSTESDG